MRALILLGTLFYLGLFFVASNGQKVIPHHPDGEGYFDPPTAFARTSFPTVDNDTTVEKIINNEQTSYSAGTISYFPITVFPTAYYDVISIHPRKHFPGFGDHYNRIHGNIHQFIPEYDYLALFHDFIPFSSWDGLFYDNFLLLTSSANYYSASFSMFLVAVIVFFL